MQYEDKWQDEGKMRGGNGKNMINMNELGLVHIIGSVDNVSAVKCV